MKFTQKDLKHKLEKSNHRMTATDKEVLDLKIKLQEYIKCMEGMIGDPWLNFLESLSDLKIAECWTLPKSE